MGLVRGLSEAGVIRVSTERRNTVICQTVTHTVRWWQQQWRSEATVWLTVRRGVWCRSFLTPPDTPSLTPPGTPSLWPGPPAPPTPARCINYIDSLQWSMCAECAVPQPLWAEIERPRMVSTNWTPGTSQATAKCGFNWFQKLRSSADVGHAFM